MCQLVSIGAKIGCVWELIARHDYKAGQHRYGWTTHVVAPDCTTKGKERCARQDKYDDWAGCIASRGNIMSQTPNDGATRRSGLCSVSRSTAPGRLRKRWMASVPTVWSLQRQPLDNARPFATWLMLRSVICNISRAVQHSWCCARRFATSVVFCSLKNVFCRL